MRATLCTVKSKTQWSSPSGYRSKMSEPRITEPSEISAYRIQVNCWISCSMSTTLHTFLQRSASNSALPRLAPPQYHPSKPTTAPSPSPNSKKPLHILGLPRPHSNNFQNSQQTSHWAISTLSTRMSTWQHWIPFLQIRTAIPWTNTPVAPFVPTSDN